MSALTSPRVFSAPVSPYSRRVSQAVDDLEGFRLDTRVSQSVCVDELAGTGMAALAEHLRTVYDGREPDNHCATLLKYSEGGPDPLDGVSVYLHKDPSDGSCHWHYVSMGFSELYDKSSPDSTVSGFGFELTFRLKTGARPLPVSAATSTTTSPVTSPMSSPRAKPVNKAAARAAKHTDRFCFCCFTSSTVLWRQGPHGAGTLCNACGVKWKRGILRVPTADDVEAIASGALLVHAKKKGRQAFFPPPPGMCPSVVRAAAAASSQAPQAPPSAPKPRRAVPTLDLPALTPAHLVDQQPPSWPVMMLQNIARHIFASQRVFGIGDCVPLDGPLSMEDSSSLTGILFVRDTVLAQPLHTPNGRVEFLQIVGVTSEEVNAAQAGVPVVEQLARGNPLLVTDMDRDSLDCAFPPKPVQSLLHVAKRRLSLSGDLPSEDPQKAHHVSSCAA